MTAWQQGAQPKAARCRFYRRASSSWWDSRIRVGWALVWLACAGWLAGVACWWLSGGGTGRDPLLGMALVLVLPGLITALLRYQRFTPAVSQPGAEILLHTSDLADLARRTGQVLGPMREQIVRVLAGQPQVAFAATLAAPGFQHLVEDPVAAGPERAVFWRPGDRLPRWYELSAQSLNLFERFQNQQEWATLQGERQDLVAWGLPVELVRECDTWLLSSAGSPDQPPLLILLGLRQGADRALLAEVLAQTRATVAPLLALHHQLSSARSQIAAVRLENDALQRLNKMQGEFVAVASHELKTPLTSIGAYTEVLLQNVANANFAPREEFLGIIKSESERLLRMVNRILDFSRLEFGQRFLQRELLSLHHLIVDTVRTLEPQRALKQQKLIIECPGDLPLVEVDKDLIRQVLINLISNAIKYSTTGGEIVVRACEDAATVRVDVQDTGPGIPADELRSIFRQFYRVRGTHNTEEGAGLGLTIVKNIVAMHDGHVDVKSREGQGSTFSCHLPKEHVFNTSRVCLLGDLMAVPQFQQVLRLCVRMIAELTGSRSVALLWLDDQEQDLVIQSALGLPERQVQAFRQPKDKGTLGQVLREGKPLLGRIGKSSDLLTSVQEVAEGGPTLALAPLVLNRRTVGVVAVANKVAPASYDADDLNLLVTLCERVSSALAAALEHHTDSRRLAKIIEAVKALVKLKRSAIPTVNPLAMRLMIRTAGHLGLSPAEIKRLQYLVALHDAGMVRVDEEIVQKAGVLNDDERDEIDSHVAKGADLMAPLLLSPEMKEIILTHHERVDGTGYPQGRQGGEIPLGSRILAVLDAFFAMIQDRPYRDKLPPAEVLAEIRRHAGTQFDPRVVECFLEVLQDEGIVAQQEGSSPIPSFPPRFTPPAEEQTWQPLES